MNSWQGRKLTNNIVDTIVCTKQQDFYLLRKFSAVPTQKTPYRVSLQSDVRQAFTYIAFCTDHDRCRKRWGVKNLCVVDSARFFAASINSKEPPKLPQVYHISNTRFLISLTDCLAS